MRGCITRIGYLTKSSCTRAYRDKGYKLLKVIRKLSLVWHLHLKYHEWMSANSVHPGTVSLKVSSASWWLGNPRRLGLISRNLIRLRSHIQIVRIILLFSGWPAPVRSGRSACMAEKPNLQFACPKKRIVPPGYLSPAVRHAAEFAIPGSRLLPSSELSLSACTRRKVWVVSVSGLIRRMSVFADKRPALSKSLSATPILFLSSPLVPFSYFPSCPSASLLFSSR